MRILFMGTPEFAVPALEGLIASAHEVVAAYSQPPRPAGRGQKLRKSPVQELAEANGIPVLTPEKLLKEDAHPKADIAVVAAYGLLLPEWFLESFAHGCINIHPSALPRWRGAAPIQRTVMAGDATTDICIMQMEKGLDTGPVLKRETFKVPPHITSGALHDMLAEKSVPLLLDVLEHIDSVESVPQSPLGVTYAKKIDKAEAKIDWNQTADEIDRLIRGLNPFPGAYFEYQNERIKLWEAAVEVHDGEVKAPGAVLDNRLLIQCGEGAIRLKTLQREGKKPVGADELLRGFEIPRFADFSGAK